MVGFFSAPSKEGSAETPPQILGDSWTRQSFKYDIVGYMEWL